MSSSLLERLKGFQLPPVTPLAAGHFTVVRLRGVDFEGILGSPDFGFSKLFDPNFAKIMVRTTSHLLGGDACGRYGYVEQTEFSLLLDPQAVASRWNDAADLQNFLVAVASSKMSLQIEDEALYTARLYSFAKPELVIAYFMWRQQEAYLSGLDRYCADVLAQEGHSAESTAKLLEGLGPLEKEEILRQNKLEYAEIAAWQRLGTGVYVDATDGRVIVDTNLPHNNEYRPYLQQRLEQ